MKIFQRVLSYGLHKILQLWEITQERSQLELSVLYATRLLNILYLMMKYHENTL